MRFPASRIKYTSHLWKLTEFCPTPNNHLTYARTKEENTASSPRILSCHLPKNHSSPWLVQITSGIGYFPGFYIYRNGISFFNSPDICTITETPNYVLNLRNKCNKLNEKVTKSHPQRSPETQAQARRPETVTVAMQTGGEAEGLVIMLSVLGKRGIPLYLIPHTVTCIVSLEAGCGGVESSGVGCA